MVGYLVRCGLMQTLPGDEYKADVAASSKGRFWLIVAAGRNVHCRHCAVTQHTYSSFAESKISLFFCFSLSHTSQSNLTNNLIYKKRSLTVYVNPLLLDLWDESISNQIELREIRIALFFCTHSHQIKSLLDASKLWNRKLTSISWKECLKIWVELVYIVMTCNNYLKKPSQIYSHYKKYSKFQI